MRKDVGLNISDLANVYIINIDSDFKELISPILNDLKEGTLSSEILFLEEADSFNNFDLEKKCKIDNVSLDLAIKKITN